MEGMETINLSPTEPLNQQEEEQQQDEGNNYMTFFTRGNSLFESGSFPEALEELEKAIQILVEQAQSKAMKTLIKEEEETTDLTQKRVNQQQTFFQRRIVKYSKFLYRELQATDDSSNNTERSNHSNGPHYVYEDLKMALNCRAKILIALGYPAMALLDSFFVLEKLEFPQSLEQGDDAVDGMINAFISMKNYPVALQNINVQIQNYQIQSIENEKTKQLNEKKDWLLNEIKSNQNNTQTPSQPLDFKFPIPTFKRKLENLLGNRTETDDQVVQGLLKECSPLHAHVITTEQYGRGMYASSELKIGQVVLSEKPFLCVTLDTENTCNNCLKKLKKKIPCKNNCGMEHYCSMECRSEAWDKYHKKLCGFDMRNVNKMISSGSSNSAKNHLYAIKFLGMLLQIVYPQGELKQQEIRYVQFIEKLEENNSSFKCLIAWPNILNDLIGKLSYHVSLDKIGNNSFKYGDAMSNGVALSSTLPKTIVYTNHSCIPNVEYRYENGKCSLIALRKIKKGEQLFISYVNPSLSAQKRAESILPYIFVCGCEKCEKDGCNKILTNLMQNYKKK